MGVYGTWYPRGKENGYNEGNGYLFCVDVDILKIVIALGYVPR